LSLLEEQKAERRARILAAARRLIAQRGFDGLTMRELARASRVSVPTLYNLFGGKHAILTGELEETFAAVNAGLEQAQGESFVAGAVAACEAANRDLLKMPAYSRELVHVFLVSAETRALRHANEERYVALMAQHITDAQARGDLVEWADPLVVARRGYAHFMQVMIQWAKGDMDAEQLRAATVYGMCLIFLGLARGAAARELERHARALQPRLAAGRKTRARKGGSS
jgi:AcrR family transcriptional regulator